MSDMKTHLVDHDPQHLGWPSQGVKVENLRLRVLISYWYYKNIDLEALLEKYFTPPYPDIFADSGAFSALTQGAEITVEEYAEWLKRWRYLFSAYANLDVIMEAKQTWENQHHLEDMGLEPVPCFHVNESWKWLEEYIDRYSYIALGVAGMQQRKDKLMSWLIRCFQMAEDRAVYHGFALTSWQVMSSFPWYSVDSSSWGQGFRYGRVPIFDYQHGRFLKLELGDWAAWQQHSSLVRDLGFDAMDFALRERNDRAKICAISALSYMLAERWLREHHGPITIPGGDGSSGPKTHLVTADSSVEAPKGGNMSLQALSQYRSGRYLSDTSNGINFRDAQTGIKMRLVDAATGSVESGRPPDVSHVNRYV